MQCEDMIYLHEHWGGDYPAPYLVYDELVNLFAELYDV